MCYKRIQSLCSANKISVNSLQRKLNLTRGSIRALSTSPQKINILKKTAAYFHVSTDFLCGITDNPSPRQEIRCPEQHWSLLQMIANNDFSYEQIEIIKKYIRGLKEFEGEDNG